MIRSLRSSLAFSRPAWATEEPIPREEGREGKGEKKGTFILVTAEKSI